MDPVPVILTLAIPAVLTAALVWWTRCQMSAATRECARAQAAERAAIRTLRLAAGELRVPAMTLLGYADRLSQNPFAAGGGELATHSAAIAGATMQVLDLADGLQDLTVGEPSSRVLRPENLALEPMLLDAMAAVDAMLGPTRRHWRLAPGIAIRLQVDRRALAQVLARVLGNAARLSRDRDHIGISAVTTENGVNILVEDEGAGLPAGADVVAGSFGAASSRGVGLGLALARTLMAAHGGTLNIQSTSQVGSLVVLTFPLSCLGSTVSNSARHCPSDAPHRQPSMPADRRNP
jgi:two-component system cell cycle sensor histidine kinase PleC